MKTKTKSKTKSKSAEKLPGEANETHKKEAYLRAYRKLGGKALACEAVGISRSTQWRWEKDDDAFRVACLEVEELDTEELEQRARERAMEKSDLLTMFLLKGRKPETYRDNASLEIGGKGGGPLEVSVVSYAAAVKAKGKEGSA